jgi:hypothetical protein
LNQTAKKELDFRLRENERERAAHAIEDTLNPRSAAAAW